MWEGVQVSWQTYQAPSHPQTTSLCWRTLEQSLSSPLIPFSLPSGHPETQPWTCDLSLIWSNHITFEDFDSYKIISVRLKWVLYGKELLWAEHLYSTDIRYTLIKHWQLGPLQQLHQASPFWGQSDTRKWVCSVELLEHRQENTENTAYLHLYIYLFIRPLIRVCPPHYRHSLTHQGIGDQGFRVSSLKTLKTPLRSVPFLNELDRWQLGKSKTCLTWKVGIDWFSSTPTPNSTTLPSLKNTAKQQTWLKSRR